MKQIILMKGKEEFCHQKNILFLFLHSRKRSSVVLNNEDDRRRSHHHFLHPSSTNQPSPSNRSRSRSPHHHYATSQFRNKTSPSSPLSSLSREHSSSNIKPDNSKISSHLLPSSFPTFNPLTLSIIERQRLVAAYASLFSSASQTTNYFPNTCDPTIFLNQNSSTLFPNLDSSAMTAALMQREYFINSLRLSQQQQHEKMIERERPTVVNNNVGQMNTTSKTKMERISSINNEEMAKTNPKDAASPLSNSSTSSSSKKSKYIERGKESPSSPSSTQNPDLTSKEESTPSL
jgi:hypothetical protein